MNSITLKELTNRNYNANGISNYKLIGECIRCKYDFKYSSVKKFMRNRKNKVDKKELWNTCSRCWHNINTKENNEWIEKNRQAQIIAQNKPEQKYKNAIGVSKSWTDKRRITASKNLKERWKTDNAFASQALKNISWTDTQNDKFYEILNNSIKTGGLKGEYNNIYYDSALELSYILWCIDKNIPIERYKLEGIAYKDENNKDRVYIPDFIINSRTIIEIKGNGKYYHKNYQRNIKKFDALKQWCQNNNKYDYRIIFQNDPELKHFYKKARKLHHEIKKQKENSV